MSEPEISASAVKPPIETITDIAGFRSSIVPRSPNLAKRSSSSPLFECIPDAYEPKSLNAIPSATSPHRCSSPCSLFQVISPQATVITTSGHGAAVGTLIGDKSGADSVTVDNSHHTAREVCADSTQKSKAFESNCGRNRCQHLIETGGFKNCDHCIHQQRKMPLFNGTEEAIEVKHVSASIEASPFATKSVSAERE
ncbi:hypothetical protein B4U79_12948 [Dinothrombium tinctorium]|uniref:Uncharacterized protein n=1 Tax=Dinothrombium tinctorium TaxID=1965070 RepID=A0A3S3PPL7_9ACAR|nr:hypothetical protein B4U79_12948 [Dinothrombium tinctorium]